MTNLLDVQNLSVFDEHDLPLLHQINLSIPSCQALGIVGESGSGKSLLIKTLLGLLPDNLSACYDHLALETVNFYQMAPDKLRTFRALEIGYIPQNTMEYLHPLLTIEEQLTDGYRTHLKASGAEARQRALELLEQVEIKHPERVLKALPRDLSGGMRQRVLIAMALINQPHLMIADEPTTALDAKVQYQVMELLAEAQQQGCRNLVIISHDLHLIQKYCDYVIVMQQGEIREVGPTEIVFRKPQSPYTQALLNVRIDLSQDPDQPLLDVRHYLSPDAKPVSQEVENVTRN